jgi:integrase
MFTFLHRSIPRYPTIRHAPAEAGDTPLRDNPLPPFLDYAAAARLLQAADNDPDPFVRLAVEFLARAGLREGQLLDLTVNADVQVSA